MSRRRAEDTVRVYAEPAQPAARRRGPELPSDRLLKVVGPKVVGGASRGEFVTMSLTDGQLDALIKGGHVVTAESEPAIEAATEEEYDG